MNMATRKIRKTGGSLSVALPKDWVAGNDLAPGDRVRLDYDGSRIVVRPVTGGI